MVRFERLSAFLVLVAMGQVSVGCRDKKDESKPALPQAPAPAEPVVAEAPAALDEKRLQALLEAWVAAQNAGDFAAYARLYAEPFTGIKRAGSREARFDRAGWLADRKVMFDKPFTVQVDRVTLNAAASMAIFSFEQTWAGPTFRDVGLKRLVVVDGPDLRISSEEMLTSNVAAGGGPDAPEPEEFAFVRGGKGGRPLVLLSRDVDAKAATGSPSFVDADNAERPIGTSALPARWQKLVGQRFALYDGAGKVCEAAVDGFVIFVDAVPHFGVAQGWGEGPRPATPDAKAMDLWNLSASGGRFLAATLDAKGCAREARFARSATLPEPTFWQGASVEPAELTTAVAAARKSPAHRELQARFEKAFQSKEQWDSTGPLRSKAFVGGTGQRFVSLLMSSGKDDSCASPFDADLWVLLQKRAEGWSVVSAGPEGHVSSDYPRFLAPLFPDVAFDLDADGRPEFAGPHDFFREKSGAVRSVFNLSPSYFDCPC